MLETVGVFEYDAQSEVASHADTSQDDVAWLGKHLIAICENEGWSCQIEEGPDLWKKAIVTAGGWLNPGFDPDKSDVNHANSASVVVADAKGMIVACNAMRMFETDSFKHSMRRGDLFYGPDKTRLLYGMPLCLESDYVDFWGRIGYSGGTYISREHRAKRLGLLTTRFVRLIAEHLHQADHHAGLIFQNRPNDPRPRNPYHFARCRMCMPFMRIPDRYQDQPLLLVDISREEFLAQIHRDVRKLVREGDQTLNDLALLVP